MINMSCSRTQLSEAGEPWTSGPSVSSQALSQCTPYHLDDKFILAYSYNARPYNFIHQISISAVIILCHLLIFFQNHFFFFKIFFLEYHLSLKQSVNPDLGLYYWQRLPAGKDVHNTNLWFKSRANAIGPSTSYKTVFMILCRLLIFFQNQPFKNIISGIWSEGQKQLGSRSGPMFLNCL